MSADEMRELDAHIAEHVMRWKCNSCVNGFKVKYPVEAYRKIRKLFHNWPEIEPDLPCDHMDKYSTNPAAAMEVLEKCCEKLGSTESVAIRWDDGQWVVFKVDAPNYPESTAETLPLAICLFAKELFK